MARADFSVDEIVAIGDCGLRVLGEFDVSRLGRTHTNMFCLDGVEHVLAERRRSFLA